MRRNTIHAAGVRSGERAAGDWSGTCRAIAVSAGMLVIAPALAEPVPDVSELGVEQLLNLQVSAASRFPQKLSEAPANVTVITASDIATFGYRTLADILNSVPGLHLFTDREYDFVGVRGFSGSGDYNGRLLVIVDGYRINDPVYATGTIGTEMILDVDLIDRVEFVQGPGSSVYGSNAFLGVVNIVSKKGRQLKGASASMEAGSHGTYKQRATYGGHFENGLDLVLSATNYDTDGADLYFPEYDAPASNRGVAAGLDGERFHNLLLKAEWGGFSLEAAHGGRKQGSPTASFGCVFGDPRCKIEDIQDLLQLRYDTVLAPDWDLQLRAYNGSYPYRGHYPYDAGDGSVIVNVDGSRARWRGGEIKLVSSAWDRHKLVAGAEFTRNYVVDQFNYDADPYTRYSDNRGSNSSIGVYAQDDFRLTQDLTVSAGARGDRVGDFGEAVSPRVALIYRIVPDSTVKLTYGSAFRAPSAYEAAQVLPGVQKANPDLDPETTRDWDLIFEQVHEGHLRWSVSAFHDSVTDLISQVQDPDDGLLVFRNVNNVEANGAQLAGELLWSHGVRARASYSWQRVIDRDSRDVIDNSPRQLAKLNLSAPVSNTGLSAGLEVLFTGERRTADGGTAGGYTVTNLTLRHATLLANLSISASAYNLFDRHYALVGTDPLAEHGLYTIAGDERSLRLKVEYAF